MAAVILSGCIGGTEPSPTPTPFAPSPSPGASSQPSATAEPPTTTPTATASPSFALPLPETTDPRAVAVSVEPEVDATGGRIVVSVTNTSDERIDEIVLRWATELEDLLFLMPFQPSDDRIREGGPPLVQEWTKWVVGPGERGEPAGTTSLGYGPILAGTTLVIPVLVERRDPEPIAFDMQLLSGNDLLELDDGGPAVLRVEVP